MCQSTKIFNVLFVSSRKRLWKFFYFLFYYSVTQYLFNIFVANVSEKIEEKIYILHEIFTFFFMKCFRKNVFAFRVDSNRQNVETFGFRATPSFSDESKKGRKARTFIKIFQNNSSNNLFLCHVLEFDWTQFT